MDSPELRNGIMDACLQPSSPIKPLALCQKLGLTPFLSFHFSEENLCALKYRSSFFSWRASQPLIARVVRPWTYQEIFDKSDLIVIATFVSTKDTGEHSILRDVTLPVKVVGVTTEFETALVLKGPKNISRFQLHHFRFENPAEASWHDI